jgi:hypothetical protein
MLDKYFPLCMPALISIPFLPLPPIMPLMAFVCIILWYTIVCLFYCDTSFLTSPKRESDEIPAQFSSTSFRLTPPCVETLSISTTSDRFVASCRNADVLICASFSHPTSQKKREHPWDLLALLVEGEWIDENGMNRTDEWFMISFFMRGLVCGTSFASNFLHIIGWGGRRWASPLVPRTFHNKMY